MFSVSFYTMGCNVNVAESEKLRAMFVENGFLAAEGDQADVIVINSCSVTSTADKGARQLLARLREKNALAVIALVGCVGELVEKNGDKAIPGADILLGSDKFGLIDRVKTLLAEKKTKGGANAAPLAPGARCYIQIQNGCDRFCSYCIVPHLRGGPVSTPLSVIRRELVARAAQGCIEVVLSGVNLALYEDGENTLIDVLRAADEVSGIGRIRLSSLEPGVMSDAFIKGLPDICKLCPHFHISLQSGCDETLRTMNRGYGIKDYLNMLDKLRAAIPGVAVTTDVIVGFPGERDDQFRDSCRGIVRCLFDDVHIFKYSKREGTVAADMPEHVTEHKKTLRAAQLQGIKQQARYRFLHSVVGKTAEVLFLNERAPDVFEGAMPHNADVCVTSSAPLKNSLCNVMIDAVNENGDALIGRIVDEHH